MNLALNNPQRLICHKTQTAKPNFQYSKVFVNFLLFKRSDTFPYLALWDFSLSLFSLPSVAHFSMSNSIPVSWLHILIIRIRTSIITIIIPRRVFHTSDSRWSFIGFRVAASLLRFLGHFSVFWMNLVMLWFGWPKFFLRFPTILVLLSIFTDPSARAGYYTRSIFKQSLSGLNSEFSFS